MNRRYGGISLRGRRTTGQSVGASSELDYTIKVVDSDGNVFDVGYKVLDSDGNSHIVQRTALNSSGTAFSIAA